MPLLFFLCSILISTTGFTETIKKNNPAAVVDYLAQEKNHLIDEINSTKSDVLPKNEQDFNTKMRKVSSMITIVRAKIQSFETFFENQKKQQFILYQKLKNLQQLPRTNVGLSIQERVAKVEAALSINKKTSALIVENLQLAREQESLLQDKVIELALWKKRYALKQQLGQLKTHKGKLTQELNNLYLVKNSQPNKKNKTKNLSEQLADEGKLLINNQHISLLHEQITVLNAQKDIIKANILLLKNDDAKTLQTVSDLYKDSISQYDNSEKSLKLMQTSLGNENKLFTETGLKKPAASVELHLKNLLTDVSLQKNQLVTKLNDFQTQLKKLVSSRQSLAEYNREALPAVFKKLLEIPKLFYNYLKILSLKVYDSYTWLETTPAIILWVLLGLVAIIFIFITRFLKSLQVDKERSSLTGHLYDGALTILYRNIPYLCLFTMLWMVLYVTKISFANYQLLFNILSIWFTFKILILIARLVLLERISDSSGKDVKLYYRLKWLLLLGGWTTALMVFSNQLPLPVLLQDIFNRLFMLFILCVSLVAWKSKDVIPYLLRPFLKHKKRYFKNAISLLVILVPFTLFTTAIIGLLGYVNLAWTMSRYQAFLLLVLVGYILIRGLLFDALELFSEWMISSLRNGWLWIEVFLKPIDKIVRITLFLLSVMVLFQLYGWHSDSLVMLRLHQLAKYPIVNITGIHITVASLVEFFVLLAIFVWASKWTREFCYRWLYKNAKDAGIRNSLSVFSQYAVILFGAFITLHVLGLDFSGMSMILGGLAVGMGFGLRDFASNIIGGIMLLIERPVREGDLITLGEYEGRVAHIGIRSMRVSSWDNMEVLIPNAETFNKPFTNWTHQDSIVRTVIPIKVNRSDDPLMIQQLILDVLAIIPEIVPDPPAQVFLTKIDEALIEFEVRYFINVQIHTRVEIRSNVLFAITAQFKAAGIKHPIEPLAIEFKEGNGDFFAKKPPSDD